MAEDKKSFVAYCDWLETFEALPDDKAGQLAKHLFRYVSDLNPKTDDILINAVFANIKNALKRDLKKYETIKLKRSESGKLGGRPKKQEKANKANGFFEKQSKAKKAVSVNDSVSVSDNVNDINNREIEFKTDVLKFTQYSNKMLIDFFNYWSQHGPKDKKMLFEKQKAFEISKRLQTWKKNEKRFEPTEKNNRDNSGSKKTDIPTGDCTTEWSK